MIASRAQVKALLFTAPIYLYILLSISFRDCDAALNANQTAEQALVATIFSGYRKEIRPDDIVTVYLKISVKQLIQLDEKNQIMTSSVWFSYQWNDPRLIWTPASNRNIEVINVNAKNIWIPDTYIINSADTDGYIKLNSDFSYVSVQYTGDIFAVIPSTGIKTRCSLNMKNYPFDTQTCKLRLTSWANPINRIYFDTQNGATDLIDLGDYTQSPVWELSSVDIAEVIGGDRVIFEDTSNREIDFSFTLKRKPLFYMMNSVFPCLILNCVTLLTYFMPLINGLVLCMSGFLTFSVYSLRISTDLPVQSDFVPRITIYFMLSISFNLLTMIWYLFRNHYTTKNELPKILDLFATKVLIKVFCWCYPPEKKTKPEEKKVPGADSGKSEKKDEVVILAEAVKVEKEKKSKCNLCDRCEACEADFKKEKDKGKTKKRCSAKTGSVKLLCLYSYIDLHVHLAIGYLGELFRLIYGLIIYTVSKIS